MLSLAPGTRLTSENHHYRMPLTSQGGSGTLCERERHAPETRYMIIVRGNDPWPELDESEQDRWVQVAEEAIGKAG